MKTKKFLNFDKVLCISPHPDDVEYSMSGVVMAHKDTSFDVLCLTTGTSTDNTSTSLRYKESQDFWRSLKLDNVNCLLNHEKQSFEDLNEAEWVSKIESFLNTKQYDAIFCTPSEDSHFEHQLCNRLMYALGRATLASLVEYKTPSTLNTWTPNLFVGINENYTLKSECLMRHFKTQADSSYFSNYCIELFHSNFAESKKGLFKFESFRIISHYC